MVRSNIPVYVHASPAVHEAVGNALGQIAVLAIRTILKNARSLEVAHQQIRYRQHHLALSSRITKMGDLVINMDVGDPGLAHHVIYEADLRGAERSARADDLKVQTAMGRLRYDRRRY